MPGISQLPLEVLIKVFQLVIMKSTWGQRPLFDDLKWLSLTCTRWRAIVTNTPSLWTLIVTENSVDRNQQALIKSFPYPLVLEFDLRRDLEGGRGEVIPAYRRDYSFIQACSHIKRWKSLKLELPKRQRLLQPLEDACPLLERAVIVVTNHRETRATVNLFGGDAPKLTVLTLSGFSIPWTSTILSGLRILSISSPGSAHPSVLQLLQIAENCPQLAQFTISDLAWHAGLLLSHSRGPTLLNSLEEFKLLDLPFEAAFQLLCQIKAPNCNVFHYAGGRTTDILDVLNPPTPRFLLAILPFFNSSNPRDPDGGELEITMKSGYFDCQLDGEWGDQFHVCFSDGVEDVEDMLGYMMDLLHPSLPARSVNIYMSLTPGLVGLNIWDSLSRLENVKIICLNDGPVLDHHPRLIEYLTNPRQSGGHIRWNFPKLTKLFMTWPFPTLVDVRRMVEGRRQGLEPRPARFDEMTIARPDLLEELWEGEAEDRQAIVSHMERGGEMLWEWYDEPDFGDSDDDE